MNTKGIKFLAVLAVLAMAFAACAVAIDFYQNDAATGDGKASSPLADGAIQTDIELSVANMELALYLPQTMSAQQSVHAVTIYGTTSKITSAATGMWEGVYYSWDSPTISFEVNALSTVSSTQKYWIYQENPALPETDHKKVSVLDLSKISKTTTGNNPSFEIPVPVATASEDKVVKLKLIRSDEEPTSPATMPDGENCVTYTLTFKAAPTEDAAAVNAGYSIVMSETVSSVTTKTYFKHFSGLLASITNDTANRTISIKSLCNDVDPTFAQSGMAVDGPSKTASDRAFGKSSTSTLTATWDLGGFTYTSGAKGGSVVDNKSITLYDHMNWTITNGKVESASKASTQAQTNLDYQLIQSYGSLTLNKVTVDLSKVTWNTESGKPAANHYIAGMTAIAGTITIKDSKVFVPSGNFAAKAVWMVMSPEWYGTSPSKVIIDNSEIVGNLSAGTYKTNVSGGFTPISTDYPELKIKSGSINGELSIMKDEPRAGFNAVIDVTPVITIEGATVESGKTMTIGANTLATVSAPADNVAGKILNNGTIVVKGTLEFVKPAAAKSITDIGLQGDGKVNVKYKAATATDSTTYTGILVLNQGNSGTKGNVLASGENTITVDYGAKMFVVEQSTGQFWYLVGNKVHNGTDKNTGIAPFMPRAASVNDGYLGFIFNPSATGASVSIKANLSGGTLQSTDYTLVGAVKLGANDGDGWTDGRYYNEYFVKDDTLTIKGETTLSVSFFVSSGVKVNVEAGASLKTASIDKSWDDTTKIETKMFVSGIVEYADSSQYYKNTVIETGGEVKVAGEGGSDKEVKVLPDASVTDKIDAKTFDDNPDAGVIVTTKAGLKEVTVPTGKEVVVEAVPASTAVVDISADGSKATINTGDSEATYTVNAGGDNKIYLEGVTGSLTFTKGSIEIDISKWTGGEIKLDDNAVVKIFGTASASADLKISMKNEGKTAQLFIEKEKEVEITFGADNVFEIGAGITFTIDGKLVIKEITEGHGDLTTNDAVIINGTVKVSDTFNSKKKVDIYGTLECKTMDADDNVVAWGTSDISGVTAWVAFPDGKALSGADTKGGLWTFEDNTLTLSNYNGNYNFMSFVKANAMATIVVEGTNKVTYSKAIAANTYFFGKETAAPLTIKTVQGTGSLEFVLNLSKTEGSYLASKTITVVNATTLDVNGADVKLTVSGTKSDWTANQIKLMGIYGIKATGNVTVYDASLDINVMSAYEVGIVTGATPRNTGFATGLDVNGGYVQLNNNSELIVMTAGNAVDINDAAFTVTGSSIDLDAKKDALTTGNGAITISDSEVSIAGEDAITTTGALTLRHSDVGFTGDVSAASVEISNQAIVVANDELKAGKLEVYQSSELEVADLRITGAGAASVNNGAILVTGSAVIDNGKSFTNKAVFTNEGTMGVFGTFENVTPGVFTNEGTFAVYTQLLQALSAANKSFTIGGDVRTDDTKAKLKSITINADGAEINADGSATIEATLGFDMKTGFDVKDDDKFEGTFTPSQSDKGYTLELTNGSATVVITYAIGTPANPKIGADYTITVSGVLVDSTDSSKVLYLEPNKNDKTITPDDKFVSGNLFNTSTAPTLTLTSGKMVNNGEAKVFASNTVANFIKEDAVYEGDLVTEIPAVTIDGLFKGDLIANGIGLVTVNNYFVGDIKSNGTVTINAEKGMVGDITAKGNVTIDGALAGIVEIDLKAPASAKLTVSGVMAGDLVYVSAYKAASDDKTDTESTAKMAILADMTQESGKKTFEINLAAATNATTSTAGAPGYFTLGSTMEAPAVGNNAILSLGEGMLKVPSAVTLPERFELVIQKDATIEVVKGAVLDVKKAALKVSKDAIAHFETGSVATTYGLVACVMSFTIEDGAYTIYSDVAYALTKCDEGAKLTVESTADIADNVSVKKNVEVTIATGVTLNFKTFGLNMDEGAKIILAGTGKITFGQTGEDKSDDTAWEFFTINGTIVFDDSNAIRFEGVRFDAAGAEISGVAATASAASKLSVKLNYSEGTATIDAGTATGTLVLGNGSYKLAKDDTKATPVFATFVVGPLAVFDAVSITDAFATVDYETKSGKVVIKDNKLPATIVGVEGILNLSNTTAVKGVYAGTGYITLAAGKEFTLAASDAKEAGDDKSIPGIVSAKIVDTTDDQNGYVLNLVKTTPAKTLSLKATTYKLGSETYNVMTLAGHVEQGIITATTEAVLNGVSIMGDAAVIADEAYIIGDSVAIGYLGAKEIYMKEGTAASDFKTLTYQVYFEDDDYTVYTFFESVDFEEVDDIVLDGTEDAYDLSVLTATVLDPTAKIDLSGSDVTITVAEGKTLTIDRVLIIGTPINFLGDDGSALVGKFIIDDDAYIIAYADVDLTLANIVEKDKKTAAVYSTLTIEEILYATIFANEDDVFLSDADKRIIPEIEGYTFTQWINYGPANAKVGDTNAYAGAMPVLLTITVKFAEGVSYYCNGVEFAIYDTPTKVDYNSVFTAKINNTAKYEGTPLINGKNSFIVTEDATLTVTGVNPIPVPPEPTPEPVEENTGLTLTDILLIVLVILIAIMVVILVLRLNRS